MVWLMKKIRDVLRGAWPLPMPSHLLWKVFSEDNAVISFLVPSRTHGSPTVFGYTYSKGMLLYIKPIISHPTCQRQGGKKKKEQFVIPLSQPFSRQNKNPHHLTFPESFLFLLLCPNCLWYDIQIQTRCPTYLHQPWNNTHRMVVRPSDVCPMTHAVPKGCKVGSNDSPPMRTNWSGYWGRKRTSSSGLASVDTHAFWVSLWHKR